MVRVQFEQCGLPFAFAMYEAARVLGMVGEAAGDEAGDSGTKLDGGGVGRWV